MPPTTMTEKSASLTWTRKHLLGLQELSAAEITQILDQAAEFKRLAAAGETKLKALSGTVVANLFFEPSTRTRTSFSLAAKRLSADTVDFSGVFGRFEADRDMGLCPKVIDFVGTNLLQDAGEVG